MPVFLSLLSLILYITDLLCMTLSLSGLPVISLPVFDLLDYSIGLSLTFWLCLGLTCRPLLDSALALVIWVLLQVLIKTFIDL